MKKIKTSGLLKCATYLINLHRDIEKSRKSYDKGVETLQRRLELEQKDKLRNLERHTQFKVDTNRAVILSLAPDVENIEDHLLRDIVIKLNYTTCNLYLELKGKPITLPHFLETCAGKGVTFHITKL